MKYNTMQSIDPNTVAFQLQVYAECFKDDVAFQLPPKHCAFRDCASVFGTEVELISHLMEVHKTQLERVARLLPKRHHKDEEDIAYAATKLRHKLIFSVLGIAYPDTCII